MFSSLKSSGTLLGTLPLNSLFRGASLVRVQLLRDLRLRFTLMDSYRFFYGSSRHLAGFPKAY